MRFLTFVGFLLAALLRALPAASAEGDATAAGVNGIRCTDYELCTDRDNADAECTDLAIDVNANQYPVKGMVWISDGVGDCTGDLDIDTFSAAAVAVADRIPVATLNFSGTQHWTFGPDDLLLNFINADLASVATCASNELDVTVRLCY